jgi:hypothetical protein
MLLTLAFNVNLRRYFLACAEALQVLAAVVTPQMSVAGNGAWASASCYLLAWLLQSRHGSVVKTGQVRLLGLCSLVSSVNCLILVLGDDPTATVEVATANAAIASSTRPYVQSSGGPLPSLAGVGRRRALRARHRIERQSSCVWR